ncbi:hypothetical protein ACS0TY_027346 [Phlomoides rotata]
MKLGNGKDAQQELTNIVGPARRVEEPDLEKLMYVHCCLKKVLHLHPHIPLLLHETAQDTTIFGYHELGKSHVMINAWAIGRDPSAWEDADEFKPSRFLIQGCPTSREAIVSSFLSSRVEDPVLGCSWGFMLSKWRWHIFSIVSLFDKPPTAKYRICQSYGARIMIDQITDTTHRLIEIYEDKDNSRKDEITALGGQSSTSVNVNEYHRRHSAARYVDTTDEYEEFLKVESTIEFAGEEAFGRPVEDIPQVQVN